jgi:hypothetical protein
MWKELKITITLPQKLKAELEKEAQDLYMTLPEYVRYCLIVSRRSPSLTSSSSKPRKPRKPSKPRKPALRGPHATLSGYKGVHAYGKRWAAVVYVDQRPQRLGVFDTPEDAARAYDRFMIARTGDQNAAVNFPGPPDPSDHYIAKLAKGQLTDIEWQQWQRSTMKDPSEYIDMSLTVSPDGQVDPSEPLVNRTAKTIYRREPRNDSGDDGVS